MNDLPESLRVSPNIPLDKQTIEQLIAEERYWATKVSSATGWGASLVAAEEFRKACEIELERRRQS